MSTTGIVHNQNLLFDKATNDAWMEAVEENAITLQNIRIAAPTANGKYKLTCTVSDGTVTYNWETV